MTKSVSFSEGETVKEILTSFSKHGIWGKLHHDVIVPAKRNLLNPTLDNVWSVRRGLIQRFAWENNLTFNIELL